MPQLTALTSDFAALETRLFAHDAAGHSRAADAFVRVEVLGAHALRRRGSTDRYPVAALRLPAVPVDLAHAGGDTIVVRSNDAALALALRSHAA